MITPTHLAILVRAVVLCVALFAVLCVFCWTGDRSYQVAVTLFGEVE